MLRAILIFLLLFFSSSAFGLDAVDKLTLDHGLIVLIYSRSGLPMLNIEFMIKAGSKDDPERKEGLANLVGEMLMQGTSSKLAEQINENIDFIGAQLDVDVDKDFTIIKLKVLKKFWESAEDVLSDILLHPSFDEKELKQKKEEITALIKKKNEDPGTIADEKIDKLIFGKYPYGHSVEGTADSIANLNQEDLRKFYNEYYLPNNTIISFSGDVTKEEVENFLSRYFLDWSKKELTENNINIEERSLPLSWQDSNENLEIKINRDIPQSTVIIGGLGISRDNPDYYSLAVANYILGGAGLSSRLMKNLREKRGLVYDVSSFFTSSKLTGSFKISLQTKTQNVDKAVNEVKAEISQMRNLAVSNDEIKNAKSFLKGSFPLRLDTLDKIAHFLCLAEFFNLGLDYDKKYITLIDKVTVEDVLRVSKKYFDLEKFAVARVGK